MRSRDRSLLALFVGVLFVASAAPAAAFGVRVESYPNMAAFVGSALHDYIVNQQTGGPSANCGLIVQAVRQGDLDVSANSAGAPGDSVVTPEVTDALVGVPRVFSGSTDSTAYWKQYLSLGNSSVAGTVPEVVISLPPIATADSTAYLGYDVAIFDLGQNLAPETGSKSSERSTFVVEGGDGTLYTVGTITNTGGNYVNVILLDLKGLPGIPAQVDRLHIIDASGTNPPLRGSLDVDGVLRLTVDPSVPALPLTWGQVKAIYR